MRKGTFCLLAGVVIATAFVPGIGSAQVNSGSDGSDGAFTVASGTIFIDMSNRPSGVYQYSSVNIASGAIVRFTPNAGNKPVVWLVQSNVVINGSVDVSGQSATGANAGAGGPGGWGGGSGGSAPSAGGGPGGGAAGGYGVGGSYGTEGINYSPIAPTYGNKFIVPLLGGSGGGGTLYYGGIGASGGGGGGGAILIAASGQIQVNGSVVANGGSGTYIYGGIAGGAGSGGAVRLVASRISGSGSVLASGTYAGNGNPRSGDGRVRFDTFDNGFAGNITGAFSLGYQPIIVQTAGQGVQLAVASMGGIAVSAPPTGVLSTPDAVLSAQQNNPVPIVVSCSNLPLHSVVTVSVKPASGSTVWGTGYNDAGTVASSTATVVVNIPRGGGIVYATAATGN